MSRSQLLIVFVCAFIGLALGILVADWRFDEPGVLIGARTLLGVGGFILGFIAGKWFLFGSLPRKFGSWPHKLRHH